MAQKKSSYNNNDNGNKNNNNGPPQQWASKLIFVGFSGECCPFSIQFQFFLPLFFAARLRLTISLFMTVSCDCCYCCWLSSFLGYTCNNNNNYVQTNCREQINKDNDFFPPSRSKLLLTVGLYLTSFPNFLCHVVTEKRGKKYLKYLSTCCLSKKKNKELLYNSLQILWAQLFCQLFVCDFVRFSGFCRCRAPLSAR